MKKLLMGMLMAVVMAAGVSGTARTALAVPTLQLDIAGGVYDPVTATVIASSDPFTLYAYLVPDANALLTGTYYISAAISPQVGPGGATLGSFSFDGTTVDVTSGMTYGTAPIDAFLQTSDPGDLPTHSVFPTYFTQFGFTFNSSNVAAQYDTSIGTGAGPTAWGGPVPCTQSAPSNCMYYAAFSVDTSLLSSDYVVHFDLYNTETGRQAANDTDIQSFAPFSHDAESCTNCTSVPEPASLLLLGSGLVGLWIWRWRSVKLQRVER